MDMLTVDSAQGRENQCTIFDLVLAYKREGGNKFVRDNQRLNVVISRSRNMLVLMGDLKSLEPNAIELQRRAKLTEEQRDLRETGIAAAPGPFVGYSTISSNTIWFTP